MGVLVIDLLFSGLEIAANVWEERRQKRKREHMQDVPDIRDDRGAQSPSRARQTYTGRGPLPRRG